MKKIALVLCLIFTVGCGSSSKVEDEPQKKVDPLVTEFKAEIRDFVENHQSLSEKAEKRDGDSNYYVADEYVELRKASTVLFMKYELTPMIEYNDFDKIGEIVEEIEQMSGEFDLEKLDIYDKTVSLRKNLMYAKEMMEELDNSPDIYDTEYRNLVAGKYLHDYESDIEELEEEYRLALEDEDEEKLKFIEKRVEQINEYLEDGYDLAHEDFDFMEYFLSL